jgi:hypothetical protein
MTRAPLILFLRAIRSLSCVASSTPIRFHCERPRVALRTVAAADRFGSGAYGSRVLQLSGDFRMRSALFTLVSSAALALASLLPAHEAQAGNVSGAQLSCYVDTYAYDIAEIGECYGVWTPSTATNPSQAVFQVVGLTAGSYTFYWTDLNTGQVGVCPTGNISCLRSIRVGQSKSVRVTVVDNATGASKTVSATAYFEDGWN